MPLIDLFTNSKGGGAPAPNPGGPNLAPKPAAPQPPQPPPRPPLKMAPVGPLDSSGAPQAGFGLGPGSRLSEAQLAQIVAEARAAARRGQPPPPESDGLQPGEAAGRALSRYLLGPLGAGVSGYAAYDLLRGQQPSGERRREVFGLGVSLGAGPLGNVAGDARPNPVAAASIIPTQDQVERNLGFVGIGAAVPPGRINGVNDVRDPHPKGPLRGPEGKQLLPVSTATPVPRDC